MSPAQLRAEWRRVFRASPPALTPDLLRRGIAYRVQERVHGGLTPATVRTLRRAAAAGNSADPGRDEVVLKPGTRLVRSWRGTTYSVLADADGFVMAGERYGSLSQVAATITGAHWSGPRFFGVRAGARTVGAAATSAAATMRRRHDELTASTHG